MSAWFAFRRNIFAQYGWLARSTPEKRFLQGRSYFIAKRIMDLLLLLLVLPLVVPLFIVCALLIKLEDPKGPIFFVQQRTGKGGRRFGIYKFRTMVHNAEELKAQLSHLNELQWPDFKITDDPRVTRVGRV